MSLKAIALLCGVVVLLFLVWYGAYPAQTDSRGMRYVLWKAGLLSMDLDLATVAMVADPHRGSLVIGKTKEQLRQRFGFILPISKSSTGPYFMRYCLPMAGWNDEDQIFTIRDTWWIVRFSNNRAVAMVIAKGC